MSAPSEADDLNAASGRIDAIAATPGPGRESRAKADAGGPGLTMGGPATPAAATPAGMGSAGRGSAGRAAGATTARRLGASETI